MDATAIRPPFSWWKLARTFIGLLLAPVVGGGIGITLAMTPDLVAGRDDFGAIPGLLWFGAAFGFILGALPALVIGWPLHLFLLSRRWTSIWVYIGLGAVLGFGAIFITAPIMEMLES